MPHIIIIHTHTGLARCAEAGKKGKNEKNMMQHDGNICTLEAAALNRHHVGTERKTHTHRETCIHRHGIRSHDPPPPTADA